TIVAYRIESMPRLRPDPAFVEPNRDGPELPIHFTASVPNVHSYATVREGGLVVTGPRSLESVRDAVKSVSVRCAVDPSLRSVAARGLVAVQVTVGQLGRVVAARDVSTTTLDPAGRDCITRSF